MYQKQKIKTERDRTIEKYQKRKEDEDLYKQNQQQKKIEIH